MDSILPFLVLAVILVVAVTAAYAGVRAAPWLPTRSCDLARALDLARLQPGETLMDLGCGDGRVLLAAAARGAHAIGYELSLLPFLIAKFRCSFSRHRTRIIVRYGDFYRADFSHADVLFCFLMPRSLRRLNTKFARECHPNARIISYVFAVSPSYPAALSQPQQRDARVYCYRPANLAAP